MVVFKGTVIYFTVYTSFCIGELSPIYSSTITDICYSSSCFRFTTIIYECGVGYFTICTIPVYSTTISCSTVDKCTVIHNIIFTKTVLITYMIFNGTITSRTDSTTISSSTIDKCGICNFNAWIPKEQCSTTIGFITLFNAIQFSITVLKCTIQNLR